MHALGCREMLGYVFGACTSGVDTYSPGCIWIIKVLSCLSTNLQIFIACTLESGDAILNSIRSMYSLSQHTRIHLNVFGACTERFWETFVCIYFKPLLMIICIIDPCSEETLAHKLYFLSDLRVATVQCVHAYYGTGKWPFLKLPHSDINVPNATSERYTYTCTIGIR